MNRDGAQWVLAGCVVALVAGCGGQDGMGKLPEPIAEDADVEVPDVPSVLGRQWAGDSHVSMSTLAATKWGLAASRVDVIGQAGDDPDTFEGGFDNGFNQQWSHAYIYSSLGFWIWGDANENFDDCITGRLADQLEGPECKDGKSAAYFYNAGDQRTGDTYLGYATHYVEDVSFVLHSSQPDVAMLANHEKFENWVKSNWTSGHNFAATVSADGYYYTVTDLQQTVRNAAWASSNANSSSAGRKAWSNYVSSGYPSGVGTGNADLVYNTKQMLIRASRYATGAIKYTLDAYGQWTAKY